jgi:4-hydroxy-tetrahydrodipicolinate synthase
MSKNIVFKGAATALVTPFINGEIDYTALARLIDWQIESGIDALVIGGTTAEAATLSDEERYRLYDFSVGHIDGRCPVILGTGTNDTRVAIKHTKYAERVGCDGALLVTPYYNKGTEVGIEKHYFSIAESTNLPIILYNVPSRTGVNLGFYLLKRLSAHPNIVGLKEASDSVDRLVMLSTLTDELALYAGNDSQIFPTLSLGGSGVVSVVSNIIPRTVAMLCSDLLGGKPEAALLSQKKILPLVRSLFIETNPAPIKFAMSVLGLCSEEVRLPLAPPNEETREKIMNELAGAADMK